MALLGKEMKNEKNKGRIGRVPSRHVDGVPTTNISQESHLATSSRAKMQRRHNEPQRGSSWTVKGTEREVKKSGAWS